MRIVVTAFMAVVRTELVATKIIHYAWRGHFELNWISMVDSRAFTAALAAVTHGIVGTHAIRLEFDMTAMLKLRDYQSAAIDATRQAWAGGIRRAAVVLPTGAGKTVVFAHLAAIMHERGVRTLVLAHRDELIEQAAAKLRAVAPDLRVGIVKGARREIRGRDVIVASVQSLVRQPRRDELARAGIRLVIVDECHHGVANTYMSILRDLGCFDEDPMTGAYALGVTATLGRSDRVALGQVWQEVVYKRDIVEMIREGYLVNARGVRVRVEGLDLAAVKRRHGDFADQALAEAMHAALAPKAVARAYGEHAAGRQGILFAPTVEMAYEMAEALRGEGVAATGIDGGMAMGERRAVLADFQRGDVQVVTNCMILTEGFDAPWCSAVVIARPTSSAPLYVQMAGRALRPHPGKQDALILDVVGVTGRHKLASVVDLVGADRVEKLPDDLAEYDEIDLLGLDEAQSAGPAPRLPGADGPLVSEIVDLFGTRRQAWLRTARGVWFLSAGDNLIFLAPGMEVGRYSVARCPAKAAGGEFVRQDLDLDMAMSWGEQYAGEAFVLTRRGATWREREPSQGQLNTAHVMSLPADGMNRGQLSDAISTVIASRRIDQMPCVASVSERSYW
jgi:superfamily II DNA or RNA helicase